MSQATATPVLLAEVSKQVSVRAESGCTYPVFAVTKHNGMMPSSQFFKKPVHSRDIEGYKVVRRGHFAYATIHLDEGSIGVLDSADIAVISPMYTVFEVDEARVYAPYLIRKLKSTWALNQYVHMGNGSVHRRRSIPYEVLGRMAIPLPPVERQKEIAAILEKADALASKRQEAIRLADEFLRSRFFELFGDPIANERRWPERTIFDVATVKTGNTPSRDVAAYYGGAIEWIKSDNINTSGHWITPARESLSELGASLARTAGPGTTLMTCIAGSASCIGNVAMTDRTVAFNQQINAIAPKAGIEPEFLYGLLLFSKIRIQAVSTNSMKGMVSKGVLERVQLIWPPANLQSRFADVFRRVQQVRSRMQDAGLVPLLATLQNSLLA